MKKTLKKTLLMVTMMGSVAGTAGAQGLVHETQAKVAHETQMQIMLERAPTAGVHVTLEARAITGAPYTAEAVTESVQMLADGNRIVRRNTVRVSRDGSGRTRREILGPDGQVETVTISDPSKGVSHMLHPATQTAHQTSVLTKVATTQGGAGTVSHTAHLEVAEEKAAIEAKVAQAAQVWTAGQPLTRETTSHITMLERGITTVGPVSWVSHAATQPPTKEDLGQQTIEGVVTKGTRSTTVIPAGAIGNEQPITIVAEEWFSPELKVLVMTKHVDPRAGETTYRLTNIVRAEPDPSLFEKPASYTVK